MTSHRLPVHVGVLAILLLCGACGGSEPEDASAPEPSASSAAPAAELIDYTQEDDQGVVLRKAADVLRLHDAPEDFKQFMAGVVDSKLHGLVEPDPDCPFSVTVRKLDTAGFALGAFLSCGGNAEMWAKHDGVWQEIWAGQTAPDCKAMEKYSVPTSIAGKTCFDEPNERDIDYTG
jgi:hypothetical protein